MLVSSIYGRPGKPTVNARRYNKLERAKKLRALTLQFFVSKPRLVKHGS